MKKRALAVALALTLAIGMAPATAVVQAAPAQAATHVTTPAQAKKIAKKLVAQRGWSTHQYSCLVNLWKKESGWRVTAGHASGAYGIPQAYPGTKMKSAGKDWRKGATTQITWGLKYIKKRYKTPCGAWSHWKRTHWY